MQHNALVNALFSAIDAKNVEQFLTFLSANCVFRFGNVPALSGKNKVGAFVSAFFDSLHSLNHDIAEVWEIKRGIVCHGVVSYTRRDGSILSVPFSNILKLDGSRVSEYLIFADTSEL